MSTRFAALSVLALGCTAGDPDGGGDPADTVDAQDTGRADDTGSGGLVDLTDAILTERSANCRDYAASYTATATDLGRFLEFRASVVITADGDGCTVTANTIPNHDFNDGQGFATDVAEVEATYRLPADPVAAAEPTPLSLQYDNAVFLNGVKLDVLAAACYGVGGEPLGQERIGCFQEGTPWRYDPMHPANDFGTDSHNAHTQPTGAYHYHGSPEALFDDMAPTAPSPVIGFAADGFPIFGPYIDDGGTIRKAVSGYTLKTGSRVSQAGEGAFPGGTPDGTFVDDHEWTDAGDLDACNGRMHDGVYGYHVTDAYPWVMGCFKGTPDPSFRKGPP